ncbi:hypothetical protein M9H77_04354 [Catharanthus roseus]|uniref:Uncharacterized protein n=1 Tax=Catharanthus roseus TaxID=4058 RepID=A0ACC0CEC4_CATRO|nr:hypothetical protein M9H77_04354 [Catharanthus roseus]
MKKEEVAEVEGLEKEKAKEWQLKYWLGPLLTVNELYYPEMIYEFYDNLHKGRVQKQGNITYQWVTSRILYQEQKCFDSNLYSKRRFAELFTKEEVLKRHDDRNVNKHDAYGRLLHHMISNIIIPNVGHKCSITNMHSFVMLALHECRRMNFGFMAIEHMLATQISSTKCLPYVCFLTKVFQYFVLNLVVVVDHIGVGKIYNKHTFKRMGFSRNEEGMLVRGGQDDNDESDEDNEENEGQKAMNVDEEKSEEEPEEETFRREMRQKKRQERVEEGQLSGSMSQLMEMIASMQASMNSRFDALDGNISDIQERVMRLEARGREEDK